MSLEDVITAAIAPASAAETSDPAGPDLPSEEAVESTPDSDPDTPTPEKTSDPEVVAQPEVIPPVVESVDEFATEHGIKAKDSHGRENRIPYSAVKRINANAVKKATEALAATHTASLSEHNAKITDYEGRLSKVAEVEHMMFEEPDKFLDILKTLPGYERLNESPQPAVPVSDAEPGPDVEGGYSPEGLRALLAWHTTKATTIAAKEAEDRIAKRYGPIETRYKKEEAAKRLEADLAPKIQAQLKDARENWLGYKEHEGEIQKTYLGDKSLTLEAAWRKVVQPKLTADRVKMRAEILAELAKAPKGTALTPSAASSSAAREAATVDSDAPIDLETIVRNSLRK